MASRLNPYLNFNGTARAAMEFYKDVFGGELVLNTYGDLSAEHTADSADKIMHGMLETDSGYTIMGADTPPDMPFNPGNTMSVSLSGDSASSAELRRYWEKLSADGTVAVPLEKQMWGDEFGLVVDRFGTTWMVNIGQG